LAKEIHGHSTKWNFPDVPARPGMAQIVPAKVLDTGALERLVPAQESAARCRLD
jgi:hypothetical protein